MNETEANPNPEKKCPKCGATLPPGALEGLCPACLLQQGVAAETGPEVTPFDPPTVEEMARLFVNLEIVAFLGKGGMGAVYKARQPALDRLVAIKVLAPAVVNQPGFAERFNREARALAKLSHPNIVGIYEFGEVNGLRYFIMEFVDGLTLRELERSGTLTSREALAIVPQICAALQFAHDEGIVHRDIKPENILMDKRGRVKIADFGIAKIMGREPDASLLQTQGAIGTPQYMAPEQLEMPQTVDHRADIFSLGVVFYEMLTGELPLGKFAPPSGKVRVDVRLDDVVLRALEKEPQRRYQRASEVKTAVETIAGAPGSGALPPPPDPVVVTNQVLARDFVLDIGSCFRRGWALYRANFWPMLGISALGVLMAQAAWSTIVGFIAGGPLMGGLSLYYLRKIRHEQAPVGTIFAGFSIAFVDLFLAGMVCFILTFLGFLCFVLPGIFLCVIWWFALTLIIDKRMPFWSAMELSRKATMRHFWKFLGFWLLCILVYAVGILVCGVGFFFAAPIAFAAATYAYCDIFCDPSIATASGAPGFGPSGTRVYPGAQLTGPGFWRGALVALALGALLLIGLVVIDQAHNRRRAESEQASTMENERTVQAMREAVQRDLAALSARAADGSTPKTIDPGIKESLRTRMDAVEAMSWSEEKNRAQASLAVEAAQAGEAELAFQIATQIASVEARNRTAETAAKALDKLGMKKSAIEMAKAINDVGARDRVLSELAGTLPQPAPENPQAQ